MFERLGQHRFHCFIGNIHRTFQFDGFFLSRFGVAPQNAQDPVCIDLKLHADTRNAFGRDLKLDLKFTELPIVPRHLTFALQYLDRHRALIAHRCREHLACFHRDR